jgi:hypothetical protein
MQDFHRKSRHPWMNDDEFPPCLTSEFRHELYDMIQKRFVQVEDHLARAKKWDVDSYNQMVAYVNGLGDLMNLIDRTEICIKEGYWRTIQTHVK